MSEPEPRVYHSRDCMEVWMLPCRCGADEANAARVIPPEVREEFADSVWDFLIEHERQTTDAEGDA